MKPPVAKQIPHTHSKHGHDREDPWFWMHDKEDPDLISYLNAENEYLEDYLKPHQKFREELFAEMKGRIKEDDASAPYFENGYWYYYRYEKGGEHPIHCRKKSTLDAEEEVLIDENIEAEKYPYYEVVSIAISHNNQLMAFSEDITGRRMYRTRIKDLITGKLLDISVENTGGDLAWMNDNQSLYYNIKEKETLRPYQIWKLAIGGQSELIYEENDDTYISTVSKTKDNLWILIGSHSTLTTEFQLKSASDAAGFKVMIPRKGEHEYYPESDGQGGFYLKSNYKASNFCMAYTADPYLNPDQWTIIQANDEAIFVEDFEVFKNHLIVLEKENGLSRLRVYDRTTHSSKVIPPFEETYTLSIGTNEQMDTDLVRIGYSSMTTPGSVYDVNLNSFDRTLIRQVPVLGDFSSDDYHSERIWAAAEDGKKVPVSLVYKKDLFRKDGSNPLLLYAYGSYGSTIDPYFSIVRLSLLNRGFVFAIAHIRGGEYLGRAWYEDGKMLKKKNTFTDFIAAGEFLIQEGYTASDKLMAMGGSAGGLLMGAVINMRPDLWRGIVSNVPFVDVITTMLDASVPLTTGEYDEWGNPNKKEFYNYMLSYSPYDQLKEGNYPAILVTSGLHDSQVQYWEPTKYVAKIRTLQTNDEPVLLFTNMDAGHGGASGRFEQLKEIAMEYTFIFTLIG